MSSSLLLLTWSLLRLLDLWLRLLLIAGGFIGTDLSSHWIFWVQVIFGVVIQIAHFFVPETRTTIVLDNHEKTLRKSGEQSNV